MIVMAPPYSYFVCDALSRPMQTPTYDNDLAGVGHGAKTLLKDLCNLLSYHDMLSLVNNRDDDALYIIERNIHDICHWVRHIISSSELIH